MFFRGTYYLYKALRQGNYSLKKKRELQLFFLKNLVEYVCRHNQFYRRLYEKAGFKPADLASLDDLERIPVVRKEDILKDYDSFVDRKRLEGYKLLETAGTTGDPFKAYLDSEAEDYSVAIFLRTLRDQGYTVSSPLGFYGHREEKNTLLNRLGLAKKVMMYPRFTPEEMLAVLRKHNLRYLYIFPFKAYELANRFDEETLRNLGLRGIFCIGEMLTQKMKSFLEERFGCPVTDNYGMTEGGIVAYQRPHEGLYTINDDSALLEPKELSDQTLPECARGVVLTSLYNYVTPFIRYDTRDYAEFSKWPGSLTRVFGRKENFIRSGKESVYLGDLVDVLVDHADSISLFSFSLTGKRLTAHIMPEESYNPRVERRLLAEIRGVLPEGIQARAVLEKKITVAERGKLKILR